MRWNSDLPSTDRRNESVWNHVRSCRIFSKVLTMYVDIAFKNSYITFKQQDFNPKIAGIIINFVKQDTEEHC